MEPVSRTETIKGTGQWTALHHSPVTSISAGLANVTLDITSDGLGWVLVPAGITVTVEYVTSK